MAIAIIVPSLCRQIKYTTERYLSACIPKYPHNRSVYGNLSGGITQGEGEKILDFEYFFKYYISIEYIFEYI